ncbi:MAG: rRNA maturation RNase YbeY [Patescibacteria group bacterium]|nr:rRNA maturation RNase YbeY [Patescibacteria group bacterium]
MIKVLFVNPRRFSISPAWARKIVVRAAKIEKKIKGAVEIALVGDTEIKKLNHVWRGKNKPTDVLSFSWGEGEKISGDLLGQIIISFPRIKAQAKEYKVSVKEEFTRMLVHGLLHLAGYDHVKIKEATKMFKLQEKICR